MSLLYFAITASIVSGGSFASDSVHSGMRRMLEEEVATGIRVADFEDLPANLTAEVQFLISEIQLKGTINISSSNSEQVSYGTYYLGPDQVRQLNETISNEMVCTFCCLDNVICAVQLHSGTSQVAPVKLRTAVCNASFSPKMAESLCHTVTASDRLPDALRVYRCDVYLRHSVPLLAASCKLQVLISTLYLKMMI